MKNIVISGNVTKDAVQRRTQNGDPVLSFDVAVNDHKTKSAMFFQCSLWGKRGDSLGPLLKKGKPVSVSGEFGIREHEGKTYLTLNASEVTLMGGNTDKPAQDRTSYDDRSGSPANFSNDLGGDEIPFMMEWR